MRELGGADDVGAGRRKLSPVDERLTSIIGIEKTGNRNRIQGKPTGVVESDYDVLAGGVDGNRGFGLAARGSVLVIEAIRGVGAALVAGRVGRSGERAPGHDPFLP